MISYKLIPKISSRYGSVVTHSDLNGEVSGSSHANAFMVLTAPQSMLVIMSLIKGNALAIKNAAHTLYNNRLPDKGGIIQRAGCLISITEKGY